MSEYTPRTGGVRRAYVSGRVHRKEKLPMAAKAEFDRWLAEHDRQVAQAAWGEGFYTARADEDYRRWREWGHELAIETGVSNPYRKDEA